MAPYRLAIVATHPTQYHAPLFRKLASSNRIDPMVYYMSDRSVRGYYDRELKVRLKWDIPLLDGYAYTFLRPAWGMDGESKWAFHPGIVSELRRHRYDALLLHGYTAPTCWLALFSAKMAGVPVIFRGEADLLPPRSLLKERVKSLVLGRLFRRMDAFLYSYTANALYFKHYGVHESRLFPFPCAVDNDYWAEQRRKLEGTEWITREQLGIPADATVILFVAKLISRKRPLDLLEAYRGLAGFNAWVIFAGDGALRTELEHYVKEHGLSRVRFIGFKNQSEMAVYYAMSNIFVLCSDTDPSPKALNEAMTFGLTPIVSDRVGTAADLIQNGDNGFVYPVGNVQALRACLASLLEKPDQIHRMGKRSQAIIAGWNYDKDVDGLLSALRAISPTTMEEATHAG